jgi:hypothetical protein
MAEMLISSGFYAFAGFGLPCDLRETITIPARHRGIRPPSGTGDPALLGARGKEKAAANRVRRCSLVMGSLEPVPRGEA